MLVLKGIVFLNGGCIEELHSKASSYVELCELRHNFLTSGECSKRRDLAAMNITGLASVQQGRLDKAAEEWTCTLELKPDFPVARNALDVVQNRLKQPWLC